MHNPTPSTLALLTNACITLAVLTGCGDDPQYRARSVPNTPSNNTEAATSSASPNTGTASNPNAPWCPVPPSASEEGKERWRLVLVEDLSEVIDDPDYPGLAIDAIELVTQDGQRHFATVIEDFNVGGGRARDTAQALGPPDADCDARTGFVSLGGREAGGYIFVGFEPPERDDRVYFREGSTITVHTTRCDGTEARMRYRIAIHISTDRSAYTELRDSERAGTATVCVDIEPQ